MDNSKIKISILGSGISGLSTAYWLKKAGYKIQIFEATERAGGTIQSTRKKGFLIDYGPNSGLETTPVLRKLTDELDITSRLVYANENANNRYILKKNKLYPLPTNPADFLKTNLFSNRAKINLFLEPLRKRSKEGYYQSVSEFVRRRIGKEFLDYAVNPFISGIYAGDPEKLSVKSALPRLYNLEEQYGSLIKGMIKGAKERKQRAEKSKQSAKMFSFDEGMQVLPDVLASYLKEDIKYSAEVINVMRTGEGYEIIFNEKGRIEKERSEVVLSTVPAYQAKSIFKEIDDNLSRHLSAIYYPPVASLYLGFNKAAVKRKLDGFGFLIPARENKIFLGAIWSSVIFPNRCDDSKVSFTLYVGGARNAQIFTIQEEVLINQIILEFCKIMKVDEEPEFIAYKKWKKAIPQYNIGYIEHENYFSDFESKNPGLFIDGNFRGGISIGDCIKNSELLFDKINSYAQKNATLNPI